MEKFIMAAGTALRISDTLKGGTTVVLLHGYLESLEIWGDFMKELAMHYRSIFREWVFPRCVARCIRWSFWPMF